MKQHREDVAAGVTASNQGLGMLNSFKLVDQLLRAQDAVGDALHPMIVTGPGTTIAIYWGFTKRQDQRLSPA